MQELQYLYGVPREDRRWLKKEMELSALMEEGQVVPIREPLPAPEKVLFGYETVAELYGYTQRGEYFFDRQSPPQLVDLAVKELECLTSTIDLAPREVHRLRDEAMDHVNFTIRWHTNYDTIDEIPIRDVAQHLNQLAYDRGKDHQWDLASVLKGIAYTIEVLTENQLAKVIPIR